jgi:hypothetical protein
MFRNNLKYFIGIMLEEKWECETKIFNLKMRTNPKKKWLELVVGNGSAIEGDDDAVDSKKSW